MKLLLGKDEREFQKIMRGISGVFEALVKLLFKTKEEQKTVKVNES